MAKEKQIIYIRRDDQSVDFFRAQDYVKAYERKDGKKYAIMTVPENYKGMEDFLGVYENAKFEVISSNAYNQAIDGYLANNKVELKKDSLKEREELSDRLAA